MNLWEMLNFTHLTLEILSLGQRRRYQTTTLISIFLRHCNISWSIFLLSWLLQQNPWRHQFPLSVFRLQRCTSLFLLPVRMVTFCALDCDPPCLTTFPPSMQMNTFYFLSENKCSFHPQHKERKVNLQLKFQKKRNRPGPIFPFGKRRNASQQTKESKEEQSDSEALPSRFIVIPKITTYKINGQRAFP